MSVTPSSCQSYVGSGRGSATSATTAAEFVDEVLAPFGARFDPQTPFRPINIRAILADDAQGSVAVVWDGEGATIAGTTYRNTYAWFMTLRDGKVVEATAFFDSIAFNELRQQVKPR